MQNIRLIFFSIVLLLGLQACGGSSGDSSDAGSSNACGQIGLNAKVINGQTCANLGTSSIVRVAAVISDGTTAVPFPICSGTMISSNDVLTATHCFGNTEYFGVPVVDYGILVGDEGALTYYAADALGIAPNYGSGNGRLFNDAAVLRLAQSPGLAPVPLLLRRAPQIGEQAFVYGYGREQQGEPSSVDELIEDALTLVGGPMTIENVTNDHIFVGFNGNGTNVCNGDSGGPMILVVDGRPTVVGVVSQGSVPGCRSGDITTFTNMQNGDILNWLSGLVPDAAAY